MQKNLALWGETYLNSLFLMRQVSSLHFAVCTTRCLMHSHCIWQHHERQHAPWPIDDTFLEVIPSTLWLDVKDMQLLLKPYLNVYNTSEWKKSVLWIHGKYANNSKAEGQQLSCTGFPALGYHTMPVQPSTESPTKCNCISSLWKENWHQALSLLWY